MINQTEIKESLYAAIKSLLNKAAPDRDPREVNRIQTAQRRFLLREFMQRGTRAVESSLSILERGSQTRPMTQRDVDNILSRIESQYDNVDSIVEDRIQRDIDQIYRMNKDTFVNRLELTPIESRLIFRLGKHHHIIKSSTRYLRKIDPEFGEIDEDIINNLSRLQVVAIGRHFPNNLRPRVVSILNEAFERGLNRAEIGVFLRDELTKIVGGNAAPEAISGRGRRSLDAYFDGLAQTNVTFARNFSHIIAMEDAGISQVQFVAIIDQRTSEICAQMNGRIFEIRDARGHVDKVIGSASIEDIQNVSPFKRDLSEFGVGRNERLEDPVISSNLAAEGVIVPPLHFRCRSEIVPF